MRAFERSVRIGQKIDGEVVVIGACLACTRHIYVCM